jgi:hypothetical protein
MVVRVHSIEAHKNSINVTPPILNFGLIRGASGQY